MSSLLVEWVEEPKTYSVVPTDNLVDGSLRASPVELAGHVADVTFGKRAYSAKILEVGMASNLSRKADKLAKIALAEEKSTALVSKSADEQVNKKKSAKSVAADRLINIDSVLNNVADPITPEVNNVCEEPRLDIVDPPSFRLVAVSPEETITSAEDDYEAKYLALKKKYTAKKLKCKELRSKYKELLQGSAVKIEIYPGSGVSLSQEELTSIKLMSAEPTVLARNLFRRLFTPQELSGHSLFGKMSNANKNAVPLPPVDAVRRNAIMNFVFKEEGVMDDPPDDLSVAQLKQFMKRKKSVKREVTKSLSDFMREESKKLG